MATSPITRHAPASGAKPRPAARSRPPAMPEAAAPAPAATLGTVKALAGSVGSLVADAAQNTLAINPLVGIRRRDVASAAKSLLKAVAVSPKRATVQYRKYLKELGRVVQGDSDLAPDAKDRRFADPAWKTNLLYRRLMQSYAGDAAGTGCVHRRNEPEPAREGAGALFRVAADRCAGAVELAARQPGGGAQDPRHRRHAPGRRPEEPGARRPAQPHAAVAGGHDAVRGRRQPGRRRRGRWC